MKRGPVCQQDTLRIIAAITEVRVIQKILRHLKLVVDPPPIAPACQAAFKIITLLVLSLPLNRCP